MKKNNLTTVLIWIFAAVPLVITAIMYRQLPAKIPTHWGLNGEVTYGAKDHAWILACLSPAIAALFFILPKIDPRKRNYDKFRASYNFFCLFMMIFFLAIDLITLSESVNPGKISVGTVVTFGVGLLFIVIGNMMPKFKSNFFMGIKNPWTLSSPEVWNRTHRLGGLIMFLSGILIMISPLFFDSKAMFAVLIGCVVLITLTPMVMSYVWYKKLEKTGKLNTDGRE